MAQTMAVLKGYELRERIGSGGFGEVFRAYQTTLGRDVAIKMILPKYANLSDFVRRFDVEAQMVARLEHPHIVPLYDYWRDPQGAFLIMRWLPDNLRAAIMRGPWQPSAVARLLDQLAAALSAAHRDNIVHRDIKPENILLDEDGNAYLADFGIAKDVGLRTAASGDMFDSLPIYTSPEQLQHQPVTPRTDLYSLGFVLYELLTGQSAFPTATTAADYVEMHLTTPLPRANVMYTQIPAALDEVLQTATAKNPTHRYVSAQRLAAAFRAALPVSVLRHTGQPLADPLTEREREVLLLLMDEHSNEQISARLVLSLGTVKWYIKQIYRKLDVHSRHLAIERARHLQIGHDTATRPALAGEAGETPDVTAKEASWSLVEPVNPYKGLRAFQVADAADFFGRAAFVEQLLNRLSENGDSARFLAVVGPSGSGKSSVVKAGLIPALRQGGLSISPRPFIAEMFPGTEPLEELEAALLRISVNPLPHMLDQLREDRRGLVRAAKRVLPGDPDTELILVIDQFEELFTLVKDEKMRLHFIDNLLSAITDSRGRVRVVLTLRADFYDRPLLYPRLAELMRTHTEVLLPLSLRELEQAIVGPAERAGVHLETGLITTILHEVGEQPGSLPLLQYALTVLFERRDGRMLTLEAYKASGGVLGALSHRADRLYEALTAEEQRAAQQLLLRLLIPGDGVETMRRRVSQAELLALDFPKTVVEEVITAFSDDRLLTLDHDPITRGPTVEVSHEALIRRWDRLQGWLNESREAIRMQRSLANAVTEWDRASHDPSYLLTGTRQAQMMEWARTTSLLLTREERAYLDASAVEHQRQIKVEQARQTREVRLEWRSILFLRALVGFLLVATVIAIGLITVAVDRGNAAEAAYATSAANLNLSEALRLAAEAKSLLSASGASETVALLAIQSLKTRYTPQGDEMVLAASLLDYPLRQFVGHTDRVKSVAMSPDGRFVLTGSGDGTVRLWDAETGAEIRQFSGHSDVNTATFSPDGRYVMSAGRDNFVHVSEMATGDVIQDYEGASSASFSSDGQQIYLYSEEDRQSRIIDFETAAVLYQVDAPQVSRRPEQSGFSPDGTLFANIPADEELVHIENIDSGRDLLVFPVPVVFNNFAFSPDNRYFAIGDELDLQVWNIETGEQVYRLPGTTQPILSVVFSPDSRLIAAGTNDNIIRVWDVETGQELHRWMGHTQTVRIVTFSADGQFLLSGGFDSRALLWQLTPGEGQISLNSGTAIWSAAYAPDGDRIALGRDDGTVTVWDLSRQQEIMLFKSNDQPVVSVEFVGRDHRIAAFSDAVRIWDLSTGAIERELPIAVDTFYSFDVSSDGRYGLTASDGGGDWTGGAILWDLATGEEVRRFPAPAGADYAVLSPDASYVLTKSSTDGAARLFDAATGDEVHVFEIVTRFGGQFLEFSPDSRRVFAGDRDGTARLWDSHSGELLRQFTGHLDQVWHGIFSQDGRLAVTSSADYTVRLWTTDSGQVIRRMTLPDPILKALFSPDDRNLLLVGSSGTVHLQPTSVSDAMEILCSRLLNDFSDAQREEYGLQNSAPVCS